MYKVHLENFDGPLDLLLFFIRRDEIDIYDIPISHITMEYLNTLDQMQQINIGVAGEFIEMAATLMRIKSKMLLPRLQKEEDIEDPRSPLVRQLLEYRRYKELAQQLESLAEERSHYFSRGFESPIPDGEEDPGVYLRQVSLYDIVHYFKVAMENKPIISRYELQREDISLDDQKAIILANLDEKGFLKFSVLITKLETKIELIVTFLAILEMIRNEEIIIVQRKLFGELEIQIRGKNS
ncbi:MAG: segregation/condensation protein A [Planctomycetia bacterium]|nr:segregation/condensation protein A [Planctomycetia bacterium]